MIENNNNNNNNNNDTGAACAALEAAHDLGVKTLPQRSTLFCV